MTACRVHVPPSRDAVIVSYDALRRTHSVTSRRGLPLRETTSSFGRQKCFLFTFTWVFFCYVFKRRKEATGVVRLLLTTAVCNKKLDAKHVTLYSLVQIIRKNGCEDIVSGLKTCGALS